jgi:hypothetical protein
MVSQGSVKDISTTFLSFFVLVAISSIVEIVETSGANLFRPTFVTTKH